MRLGLIAVGQLKNGPERDLVERYRGRFDGHARYLGIGALELIELSESRAKREGDRRVEEAKHILGRVPDGALVAFDERGGALTSPAFASRLALWRDGGSPGVSCMIGGPDGLADSVRKRADLVVSFGALTLPHQLVRVLVVEQLYRSLTILSGHPYHRAGGDEI